MALLSVRLVEVCCLFDSVPPNFLMESRGQQMSQLDFLGHFPVVDPGAAQYIELQLLRVGVVDQQVIAVCCLLRFL